MNRKEAVREAYIRALEERLAKARSSYEIAKNDTIEAEGRMVTRYDSTKTETAWLADGYLKEVKELEQCIANMKQRKEFANISDTVEVNRVVNMEYEGTFTYLLSRTGEAAIPENLLPCVAGCEVGEGVKTEERKQQVEYQLKSIRKGINHDLAAIESLVTLEDEDGDRDCYYIVNYLGGMEVEADGHKIFCVSRQTPMGRAILGRKKGEQFLVALKYEAEFTVVGLE